MILHTLLTVILIALTVPAITLMLLGKRPVSPLAYKRKSAVNSADAFIACLKNNQADIEEVRPEDEDKETIVFFRYQGGNFVGTHNANPEARMYNTVALSFFNCFEADLADLSALERVINEINNHNTPLKATMKSSADGSKLEASFHISGIRLADNADDAAYLKKLLSTFFEMQRMMSAEFQRIIENEPNAVVQNIMPRTHAYYTMLRSEIEDHASTWDGLWWETPRLTLASVVDRLTGSIPSDSARIIIDGVPTETKASEIEPFALMLKTDLQADDPIVREYMTLDILEPDDLMNRNIHIIIRLKSVEERLISLHIYAMQSGLPVSAFRPIGSPETLPRAFSSAIGIHRGGPEMFKAEAEYMAQEQGLIDRLRNGDAAYSLYWGLTLFTADRFFEAAFYLQNAYDMIAPSMDNPNNHPNERLEQFFDICFFLGITYYKLGRYRDSYYYLDIIVNQHRVKWTQQYILTLVGLHDPRLETMLHGLREQLSDQMESNEEEAPHIEDLIKFIDRQLILVKLQQHKIEEARAALEKRLEDTPDDAFALYWLAKLG